MPEGSVSRTTMFEIGQELNPTVIVTLYEIKTATSPALFSAEGEFVLRASPVSIPSGYGEVK